MSLKFRYKFGYRKTENSYRSEGFLPIWSINAFMDVSQNYRKVEFAIEQGGVKLKNEPKPSWQKYILDFLFYKRTRKIMMVCNAIILIYSFNFHFNNSTWVDTP